ncbi:MAG TPA: hypothetical protein VEA16_01755, partial [Vicinamibacterales bacterium]|nr:hypothetical protein [Vicinamibacterales bacterium]
MFRVFALCAGLVVTSAAHADVKIHGATTVAFGLINPHRAKIEKITAAQLTVLPNSTTHGLADLAQGRADIAMLAEPL